METLKRLAVNKKRTIVVSIHAPRSSIYQLFDTLMILAAGELIYFGPAKESVSHFASLGYECPKNFNPADYLIDVVTMNSDTVVRNLADKFRESSIARDVASTISTIQTSAPTVHLGREFSQEYASSFWKQIWVVSQRVVKNNLRNPFLMPLQYSLTTALSLLIGGIFYHLSLDLAGVQDRAGSLFFSIALLSFGSMSSIDTCE